MPIRVGRRGIRLSCSFGGPPKDVRDLGQSPGGFIRQHAAACLRHPSYEMGDLVDLLGWLPVEKFGNCVHSRIAVIGKEESLFTHKPPQSFHIWCVDGAIFHKLRAVVIQSLVDRTLVLEHMEKRT